MNRAQRRYMRSLVFLLVMSSLLMASTGRTAATLIPSWTRQFGTPMTDETAGVAVDSNGNTSVVGWTTGTLPNQTSAGGMDAFLRIYTRSGTEVWTHQFGTGSSDRALGVAVDSHSNTSVVGVTWGTFPGQTSSGAGDAYLRSYDHAGTERWTRQFGTSADDFATGVAVDSQGYIYVVGVTWGIFPGQTRSGSEDAFLRAYDSSGTERWTRQFGTSSDDTAIRVGVDPNDRIYVVGSTAGTLPGQTPSGLTDAYIRSYDKSGAEVWTHQFGTPADDYATSVAVDSTGTSVVVGSTGGTFPGQTRSGQTDAYIRSYDNSGMERWTRQFGTSSFTSAYGVAVDSNGTSYMTGQVVGTLPGQTNNGKFDVYLRSYDRAGMERWTAQFGSSAEDYAWDIAVEGPGQSYVVGNTAGTFPGQTNSGGMDAFLTQFQGLAVSVLLPLTMRQSSSGW